MTRAPETPDRSRAASRLRRVTHRTIAAVSEALDSFAFNVAVARLYELANAIAEADAGDDARPRWARREAVEMLARLIAPMMPHLAEEVYASLASRRRAVWSPNCPGRRPDPDLLAAETVTIAVQVMGKLRGTIARPPTRRRDAVIAAAEAEPNVARALEGKRIVKRDPRAEPHRQLRGRGMSAAGGGVVCSCWRPAHVVRLRLPAGLYADGVRQGRRGAARTGRRSRWT